MRWSVGSQLPCLRGTGVSWGEGRGDGGGGPVDAAVLRDVVVVAVLMDHGGGLGGGWFGGWKTGREVGGKGDGFLRGLKTFATS